MIIYSNNYDRNNIHTLSDGRMVYSFQGIGQILEAS